MHYIELEHLSGEDFKRLCGVSRETFTEMVEILRPHLESQGRRGGQAKLSVEDQLLVALEYWREYRSQFQIGVSWGIHETTVDRIVRKVENLLVQCGQFRLPSQRQLYQPGWEWKVLVVDVGEIEIERPKKSTPPAPRKPRRQDGASTETLLQWQAEVSYPESASVGGV